MRYSVPLVSKPAEEQAVSRDVFLEAAARQGISPEAAATMWAELGRPVAAVPDAVGLRRETSRFSESTRLSRTVRVFLYLGGVLVVGSYGWWASEVDFDAGGLLALSLAYGAAFLAVGLVAQRRRLDELAAVAATIVAFYIPVCVYAVLKLAGFHFIFEEDGVAAFYGWIDGGWIWLELAAIVGAVALHRVFRAPLLMLPLSLFTLFLAMDGAARAFGVDFDDVSDHAIGAFILAFGLLAAAVGVVLDYRGYRRHALWLHFFGAIGILAGTEYLLVDRSFELALVISGAVFLLAGVWLGRVGYLVFGGLAGWVGITALAPSPIVLTISGLALVGVAVWLSLGESPLRRWLQTRTLPAPQLD
jgi:hypothetical protein